MFLDIPRYSRIRQILPDAPRCSQNMLEAPRHVQMFSDPPECSQMLSDSSRHSQIFLNTPRCCSQTSNQRNKQPNNQTSQNSKQRNKQSSNLLGRSGAFRERSGASRGAFWIYLGSNRCRTRARNDFPVRSEAKSRAMNEFWGRPQRARHSRPKRASETVRPKCASETVRGSENAITSVSLICKTLENDLKRFPIFYV